VKRKCEQVSQHRKIRIRHEVPAIGTPQGNPATLAVQNRSQQGTKRSSGHLTNPGPRIRAKFQHLFPEQPDQYDNRPMLFDTVDPSSTGLISNRTVIASSASSSSTGPYIPTHSDVSPLPKQAVKRKFDTKPSFSSASRHSALKKAARTASVGEKPHPAPHLTEE
jgi:hypothetical protein